MKVLRLCMAFLGVFIPTAQASPVSPSGVHPPFHIQTTVREQALADRALAFVSLGRQTVPFLSFASLFGVVSLLNAQNPLPEAVDQIDPQEVAAFATVAMWGIFSVMVAVINRWVVPHKTPYRPKVPESLLEIPRFIGDIVGRGGYLFVMWVEESRGHARAFRKLFSDHKADIRVDLSEGHVKIPLFSRRMIEEAVENGNTDYLSKAIKVLREGLMALRRWDYGLGILWGSLQLLVLAGSYFKAYAGWNALAFNHLFMLLVVFYAVDFLWVVTHEAHRNHSVSERTKDDELARFLQAEMLWFELTDEQKGGFQTLSELSEALGRVTVQLPDPPRFDHSKRDHTLHPYARETFMALKHTHPQLYHALLRGHRLVNFPENVESPLGLGSSDVVTKHREIAPPPVSWRQRLFWRSHLYLYPHVVRAVIIFLYECSMGWAPELHKGVASKRDPLHLPTRAIKAGAARLLSEATPGDQRRFVKLIRRADLILRAKRRILPAAEFNDYLNWLEDEIIRRWHKSLVQSGHLSMMRDAGTRYLGLIIGSVDLLDSDLGNRSDALDQWFGMMIYNPETFYLADQALPIHPARFPGVDTMGNSEGESFRGGRISSALTLSAA